MENRYSYNNEAMGIIPILTILKKIKKTSHAKALLILPFLFHRETLNFLKSKNKFNSLDDILVKEVGILSNFNKRFYSFLPLSINSIVLLKELKFIDIVDNELIYLENNFNYSTELWERAMEIIKWADKLSKILEEDVAKLYLQLRINLWNSL